MSLALMCNFIVVMSLTQEKGKCCEASIWSKVQSFFMQVSCWLVKTSYEPNTKNLPFTLPGQKNKECRLALEYLGKAGPRKIVLRLLKNKSMVKDSLKTKGRKDSFNFFIKYGF